MRGTWAACDDRRSLIELVADDGRGRRWRHGWLCRVASTGTCRRKVAVSGPGVRGTDAPGSGHRHARSWRALHRARPRRAAGRSCVLLGEPAFYGRVGFEPPARSASTTPRSGVTTRTSWRGRVSGDSRRDGGEFSYCWEPRTGL